MQTEGLDATIVSVNDTEKVDALIRKCVQEFHFNRSAAAYVLLNSDGERVRRDKKVVDVLQEISCT